MIANMDMDLPRAQLPVATGHNPSALGHLQSFPIAHTLYHIERTSTCSLPVSKLPACSSRNGGGESVLLQSDDFVNIVDTFSPVSRSMSFSLARQASAKVLLSI